MKQRKLHELWRFKDPQWISDTRKRTSMPTKKFKSTKTRNITRVYSNKWPSYEFGDILFQYASTKYSPYTCPGLTLDISGWQDTAKQRKKLEIGPMLRKPPYLPHCPEAISREHRQTLWGFATIYKGLRPERCIVACTRPTRGFQIGHHQRGIVQAPSCRSSETSPGRYASYGTSAKPISEKLINDPRVILSSVEILLPKPVTHTTHKSSLLSSLFIFRRSIHLVKRGGDLALSITAAIFELLLINGPWTFCTSYSSLLFWTAPYS